MNGLFYSMLSHHGTPPSKDQNPIDIQFWHPRGDGYSPLETLKHLGNEMEKLFPLAFSETGSPFPPIVELQHLFCGLLQIADWIGSDRNLFPLSSERNFDEIPQFLNRLGLNASNLQKHLKQKNTCFQNAFEFSPNDMQQTISSLQEDSLVLLEAETGAGKTEAALWYFIQLFQEEKVSGLYFALPTRTAATQIHNRVSQFFQRLIPDSHLRPKVILAIPGYLKVDDLEGFALPDFQVLWEDHPDEAEKLKRWAAEHPKRFLSATISIGTIDQAFLSALQNSHAHLRFVALAKSLLIVDEVHASDPYMSEILKQLLDNHRQAGGYVLLMSATLGSSLRTQLFPHSQTLTLSDAIQIPYPSLSPSRSSPITFTSSKKEKHISIKLESKLEQPTCIFDQAIDAARQGAKVLIIKNTVSSAVLWQQQLEQILSPKDPLLFMCNNIPTLHHSRFAKEDRECLDGAVENVIGKNRLPGGTIVIGTQTLEQSLDIDADLLITDLCPIDVLLQRMGRLHRHLREYRPLSGLPTTVILTPKNRDLSPLIQRSNFGLGNVYENLCIIEATWRLLESNPELTIPFMNRFLVENGTHPSVLEKITRDLGPVWIAYQATLRGKKFAERSSASLSLLNLKKSFEDLSFPEQKPQTRLGLNDLSLTFPTSICSPFGMSIKHLIIPEHLLPKQPDLESEPKNIQANEIEIRFSLGSSQYLYNRYGLQKLC